MDTTLTLVGIVAAKRLQEWCSGDVAEELLDDTTQRVKRHPVETMAATFGFGVVVGGFVGWLVGRR